MALKIYKWIKKIVLGGELSLAVTVLRLISSASHLRLSSDLPEFVFSKLPERWKDPSGPATKEEFVAMVHSGAAFYRSVKRVLT